MYAGTLPQSASPFYLQAGYAWQQKEREILRPDPSYQHIGPDGIAGTADDALPLAQFRDRSYTNSPGFGLSSAPWSSGFEARRYWLANPQAVIEGNQAQANDIREIESYRRFLETVNAAYFMGSFNFGPLNVLAGGRLELTDFQATDYDRRPTSVLLAQRYTRRTRT